MYKIESRLKRWKYNVLVTSRDTHERCKSTGRVSARYQGTGGWPLRCAPIEKSVGARIDPSSFIPISDAGDSGRNICYCLPDKRSPTSPYFAHTCPVTRAAIPPRFPPLLSVIAIPFLCFDDINVSPGSKQTLFIVILINVMKISSTFLLTLK